MIYKIPKLFTNPEDTISNPLTRDKLMDWLAGTGFVDNYIKKHINSLDLNYLEDYIQECWLQILSVPDDKIMAVWHHGKGQFVNYIKGIISRQIHSKNSRCYYNIRKERKNEYYLTSDEWNNLINDGSTCCPVRWLKDEHMVTDYDKYAEYKEIIKDDN